MLSSVNLNASRTEFKPPKGLRLGRDFAEQDGWGARTGGAGRGPGNVVIASFPPGTALGRLSGIGSLIRLVVAGLGGIEPLCRIP